jgi:hypothetical protein
MISARNGGGTGDDRNNKGVTFWPSDGPNDGGQFRRFGMNRRSEETNLMKASISAVLLCCLLLTGCESWPLYSNRQIKVVDENIAKLGGHIDDTNKKLGSIQDDMDKVQKAVAENSSQRSQGAADTVFVAAEGNRANPQGNRHTLFVDKELFAAAAFLPGPSPKAMLDSQQLVPLIPSDKPEDIALLRARLNEKLEEADRLHKTNEVLLLNYGQLQEKQHQAETERDSLQEQRDSLHKEKEGIQNQLLAKAQQLTDRLKRNDALRGRIVWMLTLAAILAGGGAAVTLRFYPPLTIPLAIAAAGFGFGAYLVSIFSPWMGFFVAAAGGAAVCVAVYIKHHRLAQIADNSIGAIQEMKNQAEDGDQKAKDAYAALRPHLVEWFGGETHPLHSEIKDRLRKLNQIS